MTEPAECKLVPLSAASAPMLAALISAAADDPWDARFVASIMHLPGTIAFAAELDGKPEACALARAIAGGAELLIVAVAEPARRRGLARALLARVLEAAAAAGAREIHLEVREANAPARALYRAAGFTEAGRRRRYYKDGADALVLRRALAPQ